MSSIRVLSPVYVLLALAACDPVKASGAPDAAPGPACTVDNDCTDPGLPFCNDQHCEATCAHATQCTDPTAPRCAADGVCVGCEGPADCEASAPICDPDFRACRGCKADSECPGGMCVEATGVCVGDGDAVFVTMMGEDSGTCTRQAPCATIKFAFGQLGPRKTIHVLGGSLFTTTVDFGSANGIVLDGEDTTLSTGNTTVVSVSAPGSAIIEGFRMAAPPPGATGAAVQVTGTATLDHVTIDGNGGVLASVLSGGRLSIVSSHLGNLSSSDANQVPCTGGTLDIEQSTLEKTIVGDSGTCMLTVRRNRFESDRDGSVRLRSGTLVMEDNLIIHRDGFNDSIVADGLFSGSVMRFNTIVNTTALPSDGAALNCDESVLVTSNVFAYNSGHPIVGTGCNPVYSVFDSHVASAPGTGNQVTGIETIFVNRASGDYHLAEQSVARGGAEPGQTMVTVDFDGNPRPAPSGTTADCGAFEAP
jgi:hypothetical protein